MSSIDSTVVHFIILYVEDFHFDYTNKSGKIKKGENDRIFWLFSLRVSIAGQSRKTQTIFYVAWNQ